MIGPLIAGCLAILAAVTIVLVVCIRGGNDYPDPHKQPWEDEP